MLNRAGGLLGAVERVYEAALAPERWPAALETMVEHFESGHMVVMAQGRDAAGSPFLGTFGVDEGAALRTAAAYVEDTPFNLARLPKGVVFDRAAVWPDRDFERSTYYNEYVRPMNGFHALAMLQANPEAQFHMGLCRPKGADAFDSVTVLSFDACARHVATALEFQHRLGSARRYCAALEQVVDRVADAVILTDAGGVPVFTNARADRLLSEADGLSIGTAGLTAANPKVTRWLRAQVAAVAGDGPAAYALCAGRCTGELRRINLDRPSGRPRLSLVLLPIWRLDWVSAGATRPRVVIFVTEPDIPPQIDEAGLCESFGLRRREATVAALLATGLNPSEIAAKLGIGIGTVRNHLKSAFLKTDTHSQSALAVLVRGFVVPAPPACWPAATPP